MIAQWRQLCEHTCVPDNPILALRYELGRLQVTRNDEYGKTVLSQGDEDVPRKVARLPTHCAMGPHRQRQLIVVNGVIPH